MNVHKAVSYAAGKLNGSKDAVKNVTLVGLILAASGYMAKGYFDHVNKVIDDVPEIKVHLAEVVTGLGALISALEVDRANTNRWRDEFVVAQAKRWDLQERTNDASVAALLDIRDAVKKP